MNFTYCAASSQRIKRDVASGSKKPNKRHSKADSDDESVATRGGQVHWRHIVPYTKSML
jgi:hypothetical protein